MVVFLVIRGNSCQCLEDPMVSEDEPRVPTYKSGVLFHYTNSLAINLHYKEWQ